MISAVHALQVPITAMAENGRWSLLLASASVVCALLLLGLDRRAERVDAAEQEVQRHRKQLLKSVTMECDGRSVVLTTERPWPENLLTTISLHPALRQVFHITLPERDPVVFHHVLTPFAGDPRNSRDVTLPEDLGSPMAIHPTSAPRLSVEDVQTEILPSLAAKHGFNHEALDLSAISDLGLEITYVLAGDAVIEGRSSEWVGYRRSTHGSNPS